MPFLYSVKVIRVLEIQIYIYIYNLVLYVFSDVQLLCSYLNDPLQHFATQIFKLGFFPSCFFKTLFGPIFLQNYDFNKAFRQSQAEDDRDDSRGMCFNVSRWAPLHYNAVRVDPEINPVLLAIGQTVFHTINVFSKEWQIKYVSN